MASMVAALLCRGDKGEAELDVLFDTGAGLSFIRRAAAERLGAIVPLDEPYIITIGDGSKIKVGEACEVALDIGGKKIADRYLVLDDTVEDLIVGEQTMRKAGLKIDMAEHAIYAALRVSGNPKSKIPNPKLGDDKMNPFKKLLMALGLSAAEDVSEDDAIKMVKEKIEKEPEAPKVAPEILTALGLAADATVEQAAGKILVLSKPADTVPAAELAALQAKVKEQEIASAVDKALAEGKLTPAEKEWALGMAKQNLAVFDSFVAQRPKVLPVGDKLPQQKETPASAKLDDVTLAVMKQLGLSKETYEKYNAPAV